MAYYKLNISQNLLLLKKNLLLWTNCCVDTHVSKAGTFPPFRYSAFEIWDSI